MNIDDSHESERVRNPWAICREIPGWCEEAEIQCLHEMANRVVPGGIWVELGVWKGRSLMSVGLGLPPGCQLWGIDHFHGSPEHQPLHENPLLECLSNVRRLREWRPELQTGLVIEDVVRAASRFSDNSLDVVYIDACHDFHSVCAQILTWLPKLKPGGYFLGHDYQQTVWPDVTRAVRGLLPEARVCSGSIWIWSKPKPESRSIPRLSIIVSTIGRPSLKDTLTSLRTQPMLSGDEVLLVCDGPHNPEVERAWRESQLPGQLHFLPEGPHHDWGAAARTLGQNLATGTHLLWQDDDDLYLPGAFETIRREIQATPDSILLFRLRFSSDGRRLWAEPKIAEGNVSTQMAIIPRQLQLGTWGTHYTGDFSFIDSTHRANPQTPVRFVDLVTVLYSR